MAKTITTNGDAQVDTAQSKFGGASGEFDGNGDYLSIPASSDFDVGSGDFTIDFWFRPTAGTQRQALFAFANDYRYGIDFDSATTPLSFGIWASSNGTSWNMINADGGGNGIGTANLTSNQWYHIAFVRYGNNFRLYIDGVVDIDVTVAGTITSSAGSDAVWIGRWGNGIFWLMNHIDEFRFSKGTARWTADFSGSLPSAAYTCADSYTKLLVHCDGADASTTFTDDDSSCVTFVPQNNLLLMGVS